MIRKRTSEWKWIARRAVVGFAIVAMATGCARDEGDGSLEKGLRRSLLFHSSFDADLNADFSKGDATLYAFSSKEEKESGGIPAELESPLSISSNGRFGGALHISENSSRRIFYKGNKILDYSEQDWDATVSLWLRVDPDADLPPVFCDPIRIEDGVFNHGFIFIEWSKDHDPRRFRYAILPEKSIWNPGNQPWESIPTEKRPMVEIDHRPFSREKWTHVAFTLSGVNGSDGGGSLYVNGELQGAIPKGWNLRVNWKESDLMLALGVGFVGGIDDLAVFDRVLNESEIGFLYEASEGVETIYRNGGK